MKRTEIESECNWVISDILNEEINKYRHKWRSQEAKIQYEKGSFPFIPNYPSTVIKHFIELKHWLSENRLGKGHVKNKIKFLDVGCGIGNILIFAVKSRIAHIYHGLELDDIIINNSKDFIKRHTRYMYSEIIKIYKQDILTFNKYHLYDILYYYRPFQDYKLQLQLELKIENKMKKGAILIPYYKYDFKNINTKQFKRIGLSDGMYIYIKQ